MDDCLFCKIIKGDIPSDKVYENEDFIVIKDINPYGPVSLLTIPKAHIATVYDLKGKQELLGEMMNVGIEMVEKYNLQDKGFAFHINGGGVQEVDHLHLKLGGGWDSKDDEHYPTW